MTSDSATWHLNERKRNSILEAARRLFFASGFEAIGIEEIAAAAGVSKVTVYAHFGSKLALLSAVVAAETKTMVAELEAEPGKARSLRDRLCAFGSTLIGFLTSRELLGFQRLLTAQAERHPEMARAMAEAGPRAGELKVAAQLAAAQPTDGVFVAEPRRAAAHLMSLWHGRLHAESLLGLRDPPTQAEVDQHIAESTELFLRAYRVEPGGRRSPKSAGGKTARTRPA